MCVCVCVYYFINHRRILKSVISILQTHTMNAFRVSIS